MIIDQRFNLIKRNTAEILTEEDLWGFLESGQNLKHYIGFEISGKVHLGTGLLCMQKVKDFMDAGAECVIFLADWHTWINDKLNGDFETIKRVAVGYFEEAMNMAFVCVGGDRKKLNFVLGSELYHHNDSYWEAVIDVAKHTTLSRMQRSITILGRKEGGDVDFAKLIYPAMQVADVFNMNISLAHAGMDQRKAHVIVRDVADKLGLHPLKNSRGEAVKPIAIHHELLLGLGKPGIDVQSVASLPEAERSALLESLKMSKSKEASAIFIHDSEDEIKEKITRAFCPPQEVSLNPILNWARLLIFSRVEASLEIKRDERFGGNKAYKNYADLEADFKKGDLHPVDLKNAVAKKLIAILAPAREHFSKGKPKEMLEELDSIIKNKS